MSAGRRTAVVLLVAFTLPAAADECADFRVALEELDVTSSTRVSALADSLQAAWVASAAVEDTREGTTLGWVLLRRAIKAAGAAALGSTRLLSHMNSEAPDMSAAEAAILETHRFATLTNFEITYLLLCTFGKDA